jgi:hypothetical protein
MVVMAILLIPSVIFAGAGHKLAPSTAAVDNNVYVVPLEVTNEAHLAAMDIPLKFSEGVTLREVRFDFEGSRVSYFDLKAANINNEERTVIIGLLPQITAAQKEDLKAGTGPVAQLVFEAEPTVTEVTLETFQTKNPGHFLAFVYHDFDESGVPHIRVEHPKFEPVTVSLSGAAAGDQAETPDRFDLDQNYPNPFNPSTEIHFSVPVASHVDLTVYNVLGQKVETLVNGQREAGYHSIMWDATPYASGVYFYRITAKDFSATKKMLLLK